MCLIIHSDKFIRQIIIIIIIIIAVIIIINIFICLINYI